MAYLEFLRVRTRLLWFGGILLAVIAVALVSAHSGHLHVQAGPSNVNVLGDDDLSAAGAHAGRGARHAAGLAGGIPVDPLLLLAGFMALIFASIVGPSLNREWDTLDFSWTQPISRVKLALVYMSVDAAGIACAFLFAFCCTLVPFAANGWLSLVAVQSDTVTVALVALGSAFMWYALLQAASSWYAGRAAGVAQGVSWAAFTLLLSLGKTPDFGPLFHDVVLALNFLNPLAYVDSFTVLQSAVVTENVILPLSLDMRLLAVWSIGLTACAIAVAGWKRLEA
ncbi:MAG: hypothetical protein ACLPYS_11100 [Vulcanimicrobiaceae bacterium]